MRPRDRALFERLSETVASYDKEKRALPRLQTPVALETFVEQLLESIHRVQYVPVLLKRELSKQSMDPRDDMFDPVRAAILYQRKGNLDEAFWLVFLLTNFGRHRKGGWQLVKDVYGHLDEGDIWNWVNTSSDPAKFRKWLDKRQSVIKSKTTYHGFSNHRKYESLSDTGIVVESYINWVGPTHKHKDLLKHVYQQSGNDPKVSFDNLFHSMAIIKRFGRTARFDYLTMVGHMGLANIEPGFAYLQGSTGPIAGAKLLFCGERTAAIKTATLETWLIELDADLRVGMQVLEDALCNWQKSPEVFKRFRG